MPRGSSSDVYLPLRRSWEGMTNSTVVNQWESSTTTRSYGTLDRTSVRSRFSPSTRLKSLPSFSSRRVASGSMMVGTWASSPQPTTSPMVPPAIRRIDAVLHIAVEIERPGAAFAADARSAVAAEGLAQVAHEEAIVPHQSG